MDFNKFFDNLYFHFDIFYHQLLYINDFNKYEHFNNLHHHLNFYLVYYDDGF